MEELADEAADAISEYAYSRAESDSRFERMMAEMRQESAEMRRLAAEMRQEMAEFRTQVLLAIFVAAGLIIAAVGLMMAFID